MIDSFFPAAPLVARRDEEWAYNIFSAQVNLFVHDLIAIVTDGEFEQATGSIFTPEVLKIKSN